MKFKLIILVIVFTFKVAFASHREVISDYPFVGKLRYLGVSCSAFMVKHGVLISAKHCFSHYDIFPENFESQNLRVTFNSNEILTGDNVFELVFDRGENDLAYIIYDPDFSREKFDLSKILLSFAVEENVDIFRIGFPGVGQYQGDKILTHQCRYLGNQDVFPPKITDPGYDGILLDTDCKAWHGDSGGPVMRKIDGHLEILGVLSHTFEVDFAGEIKEESMGEDDIGPYVKTSMFSPLSEAVDLEFYLRD
ncbi:MAG: hypothetical protein DRQ88_03230 [Epsilonproteobacteria bacterium]|nr:MAG: hypothetical protein DRQ89_01530 [Campylobacterota bacterium]RLA67332.1 MAG: hypothetical protein DRQ88_03230 [Campylobacterota bacterium]